ncbi:MAG: hypothetical protein M3P18_21385 [Actinomycetota bacterium]|nr:hypothetical protein [Actinomycetota bacterium]
MAEPARLLGADRKTRKRVRSCSATGGCSPSTQAASAATSSAGTKIGDVELLVVHPDDPTERAFAVDVAQKVMRVRKFPIPTAVLAVLEFALLWFEQKRALGLVMCPAFGGVGLLDFRRRVG